MKRTLMAALAAFVAIAGCSPKHAEISGTVKGMEDSLTILYLDGKIHEDTITVNADGSFHYELDSDEVCSCMMAVFGQGTMSNMFIPGEKYHYDIDLTVKPSEWKSDGRHQVEDDAYRYYKDSVMNSSRKKEYKMPEAFADHAAWCDKREAEITARFSSLKNRSAREYLTKKVHSYFLSEKFRYGWNLEKNGRKLDSDAEFNAFVASIDLTDKDVPASMTHELIRYWTTIYSDTLNPAISEIKAINEVVPDQHTKDSLIAKFLEIRITDGQVESQEEGDALIEAAEKSVKDEATVESYRQMIAKTLSLAGSDEIDFEMSDADGKSIMLSDLKGKAVYIDFWATWCLPCLLQIPHMETLADQYRDDRRIVLVSVSMDRDVESWKTMIDYKKPAWPQYVAKDGGKEIYKAYGFRGIPRFMLFDKDGKIVSANAPRPQDMEKVIGLIEDTLSNR